MEPKNWQDLVTQALLMPFYNDVDDIKKALRGRFGKGTNGTVKEWYEYLVWLDRRKEKDRLLKEWSEIWKQSRKKGIELKSIPYNVRTSDIVIAIEKAIERMGE